MSACQRPPVVVVAVLLVLALAAPALAAGVQARFDLSSPTGAPFPSNRFTTADPSQRTGVRVNLPKPAGCPLTTPPPPAVFTVPTDCFDIDELNTLDGFNPQPRIRVPFTGAIDPTTVAGNVFFVRVGGGQRVGVNQAVWDPATNTLFAESDEFLEQRVQYALIVTNGVHDTAGDPIEAGAFGAFRRELNFGQTADAELKAYRKALLDAIDASRVDASSVVAASIFTTQSATSILEKIRAQVQQAAVPPVVVHGSFPRLPGSTVVFNRQVRTDGSIITSTLPLDLFDPGFHIGALVFGSYASAKYQTADQYIPPVGTLTGVPAVQSTDIIQFHLFVPAGTPPAAGWPVAIFGHGFADSKQGAPFAVASTFAAHGIATIAINVVGHGGGAGGSLVVLPQGAVLPTGGRGIDQNGDGLIDSTEGVNAAFPRTIVGSRDSLRQTVIDLIQLVRIMKAGGVPSVDGNRIYYAGQSFGGIYGTKLLAVEPTVRAGVLNVPGGPITEIARLSPVFRLLVTQTLSLRVPPRLNGPFPITAPLFGFDENIPLRNRPPVVNTVAGAVAIQEVFDNTEWASQSGNPVAYAPLLAERAVIVQAAKGDLTVPNPPANNLVRAGGLYDRLTYYRNDLADAANSAFPNNPHGFLIRVLPDPPVPASAGGFHPDVVAVALAAQAQIAIFFVSDGATVVDPDGAGALFETPIAAGQIPGLENLNFLP